MEGRGCRSVTYWFRRAERYDAKHSPSLEPDTREGGHVLEHVKTVKPMKSRLHAANWLMMPTTPKCGLGY